jgi:hypothetical protein
MSTNPTIESPADNLERSKIFGALLRRIDHHAARLGAGHAANFERGEITEPALENTFDTLQMLAALVDEAKEKIASLDPTIS